MSGPKIAIVGGGSNAWAPNLVKDMLLTPALKGARFHLLDIRRPAADLVKGFADRLARQLGVKAAIVATDDRRRALDGADFVIITISTGGLDAMAHDLAIPERFGIYHTVGDTSGPGGWARLIRNFEVFHGLARDLNRLAPGALVLNYTNPMTTLTDVLARVCERPVVGLCHGLFENLRFLGDFYKLPGEADMAVAYAGLNHFFWITAARAGRTDMLADLGRRLRRRGFTDLLREASPDPMGFRSHRELATELFRQTGVMPYLGDRHTCEFFSCYVTNRAAMKRYRLVRTSIADRRRGFRARERRLRDMASGRLPFPEAFTRRSRETAADIIEAVTAGRSFVDVGNTPNVGQVGNLPRGAVVETAVRVTRNGFTPLAFGDLPPLVAGWVEPWTRVFGMTVDACFRGDRTLALQALRLDPVCAHLAGDQVRDLGLRLLGAHRRFIRTF